tara:strand:+ start:147 stop:1226 length:1080 start_codon:yes stop_codon:yes gene_type:complete
VSKGIGDYTKYLVGDEGFLIDTSNTGSALLDLGILGLAATGVGAPIAAGLKAGTKARKAKKLIEEAKKARKRRLIEAGTADLGTSVGELAVMGVDGMAKGGLADLPVQNAFVGKLFTSLSKAGQEIFTNPKIKNKLSKDQAGPNQVIGREIDPVMTGGTGLIASLMALISDTKDRTKEEEEVIEQAAPVKEPEKETFLDKLRDMDPALARALIAGGAKMLQPTEGPVRSFLGLGEFGEGFSESLAASEAGKPVEQKAYEAYAASVPEGETVPTFADYMNYFTLKQEDRMATESKLIEILRDRHGKNTKLADIVLVSTDPNTGKEIAIGANEALLNAGVNYKEVVNKIAKEGIPKSKLEE